MSSEAGTSKGNEIVTELYFLIQKCLSVSPLKETHQMLVKELESSNILPNRLDWKGNEHRRNLAELEKHYPHIGPDYLLKICSRLGCILDRELPPSIKRAPSLLGAGRQSLLRRTDHKRCNNAQLYYAARIHGKPLLDPPFLKSTHNIVNVCIGRQMSGPTTRHLVVGSSRYANLQLQRRTLGHLSAVYCLLFDRTGRFIVTVWVQMIC
ncbi:bromodomain and WD repeat-containing protein 3-like isoform X2 [Photinus pyralis]|uniref:bromodomain and WD repeat-containing protein 3-like isoform X2 n=1 Tax=Photinus pyralis TaxID=7054 RepID=UPI0012676E8F|nr:bromodomain and WD repeat-containing protein 3-like isoform X2 [Photinus pyralis]XP_031339475.1 bromodomain and WD repeat-containing protein 3-like isoform X2 [Photinus pyralis]